MASFGGGVVGVFGHLVYSISLCTFVTFSYIYLPFKKKKNYTNDNFDDDKHYSTIIHVQFCFNKIKIFTQKLHYFITSIKATIAHQNHHTQIVKNNILFGQKKKKNTVKHFLCSNLKLEESTQNYVPI